MEALFQLATQYTIFFLVYISIVAIATAIVTEITKNTKPLDKIPTEVEVLVLSIVFSILFFFMYVSYYNFKYSWIHVILSFFIGLISAYVSMFGWEKLITIKNKYSVPKELRDVYKLTYKEKNMLSKVSDLKELGVTGPQGAKGEPGKDGLTPHIDEETGNWFIGDKDTGVSATPNNVINNDNKDSKEEESK